MITVHVSIAYTESDNPIASPAGTRAMIDFIELMEDRATHPDVEPLFVAWKDQRPPAGYGFFRCTDVDTMAAFLKGMPHDPTVLIEVVHAMDEMLDRGRNRLAEA